MDNNIQQFLTDYRVSFHDQSGHSHATRGWIQTDCPQCSPDSGWFRLGISTSGRSANCWVCGPIKVFSCIKSLTGAPSDQIIALLKGARPSVSDTIPRGILTIPKSVGDLTKAHKAYLRRRGFDPAQLIDEWDIQGISISKKLGWRIFIPVTLRGKVVSWTTRSISDKSELRYISAKPEEESVALKSLLYGQDKAKNSIVVVEGPFDVWRIGPGAVCTFGISYSKSQLMRIASYPMRTIIFDKDKSGRRAARRLCRELAEFEGVTNNVELDSKDPGSACDGEIAEIRRRFLI